MKIVFTLLAFLALAATAAGQSTKLKNPNVEQLQDQGVGDPGSVIVLPAAQGGGLTPQRMKEMTWPNFTGAIYTEIQQVYRTDQTDPTLVADPADTSRAALAYNDVADPQLMFMWDIPGLDWELYPGGGGGQILQGNYTVAPPGAPDDPTEPAIAYSYADPSEHQMWIWDVGNTVWLEYTPLAVEVDFLGYASGFDDANFTIASSVGLENATVSWTYNIDGGGDLTGGTLPAEALTGLGGWSTLKVTATVTRGSRIGEDSIYLSRPGASSLGTLYTYVNELGDDGTGEIKNPDLPFQSIGAAITAGATHIKIIGPLTQAIQGTVVQAASARLHLDMTEGRLTGTVGSSWTLFQTGANSYLYINGASRLHNGVGSSFIQYIVSLNGASSKVVFNRFYWDETNQSAYRIALLQETGSTLLFQNCTIASNGRIVTSTATAGGGDTLVVRGSSLTGGDECIGGLDSTKFVLENSTINNASGASAATSQVIKLSTAGTGTGKLFASDCTFRRFTSNAGDTQELIMTLANNAGVYPAVFQNCVFVEASNANAVDSSAISISSGAVSLQLKDCVYYNADSANLALSQFVINDGVGDVSVMGQSYTNIPDATLSDNAPVSIAGGTITGGLTAEIDDRYDLGALVFTP